MSHNCYMVALEYTCKKISFFCFSGYAINKEYTEHEETINFLRAMFNLDKVFLLRLIAFLLKTSDIVYECQSLWLVLSKLGNRRELYTTCLYEICLVCERQESFIYPLSK